MSETQEKMVAAARELLLGDEFELLAGVTVSRVAERAGVPLRSAKRAFKTDELRRAVIEDLVRVKPGEDVDTDAINEFVTDAMESPAPLAEDMQAIVDAVYEHNASGSLFRAQLGFAAFAHFDTDVSNRLVSMYDQWIREGRNGMSAYVTHDPEALQLEPDTLTVEEYIRVIVALAEGLAIQTLIEANAGGRRTDVSPVDPTLAGRAARLLLERIAER